MQPIHCIEIDLVRRGTGRIEGDAQRLFSNGALATFRGAGIFTRRESGKAGSEAKLADRRTEYRLDALAGFGKSKRGWGKRENEGDKDRSSSRWCAPGL
jgi:hypothetical protein